MYTSNTDTENMTVELNWVSFAKNKEDLGKLQSISLFFKFYQNIFFVSFQAVMLHLLADHKHVIPFPNYDRSQ